MDQSPRLSPVGIRPSPRSTISWEGETDAGLVNKIRDPASSFR